MKPEVEVMKPEVEVMKPEVEVMKPEVRMYILQKITESAMDRIGMIRECLTPEDACRLIKDNYITATMKGETVHHEFCSHNLDRIRKETPKEDEETAIFELKDFTYGII